MFDNMESRAPQPADEPRLPKLGCRQDFGNLRWIDRCGYIAVDDLQFSASGLVRDRRYLSLDNFAAVEAHPDAGAYAVIHILSIRPSIDGVMVVTWEARDLSKRLTCGLIWIVRRQYGDRRPLEKTA
jgi:hypothetical protein